MTDNLDFLMSAEDGGRDTQVESRTPMVNVPAELIAKAPALAAEVERLREALERIAKGEGPFSMDRLTHAENTIAAMIEIAKAALEGSGDG